MIVWRGCLLLLALLGPGVQPCTAQNFDPEECGSIDGKLLTQLRSVTTACPLTLRGSAGFDSEGLWGDALVAFNREGAMVAIHERPQPRTYAFDGVIDHVGHEGDTLYWGLWRSGTFYSDPGGRRSSLDEGRSMAYIVGVSSYRAAISDRMSGRLRRLSSLPAEGATAYSMIGQTGVVSNKDNDGHQPPIGEIREAHATLDFKTHTGMLDVSVEVRGATATIQLPLKPKNESAGFDSGAISEGGPCIRPAPEEYCPQAEVQFYGRDGEFLGVTFTFGPTTVMPFPVWSGARLNNVFSKGSVVLRRK